MSLVIDRIIDQIELIELCFFTYPPCLDPSRLQLMKLWQFFHFGKYIFLWTERDSTDSAHFCRVFPLYQRLPAVTLPGVTRWPVSRSPGRWALARQTLSPIKHGWEIPELASYGKLGKSWTKFGGFSSHVWWWQEGEFCVAKHRILICKNQHNS